VPVHVVGPTGAATLTGVSRIVSDVEGSCAVLAGGTVDCWGDGWYGKASAVPYRIHGLKGSGTLAGVTSLFSDGWGYCALLSTGSADCWGRGDNGDLGNGKFYLYGSEGSFVPVRVEDTSGSGSLTDIKAMVSDSTGYCALLHSGSVDCWGYGVGGELGNGMPYNVAGSAVPVRVLGTSGAGLLTGVTSLTAELDGYCALLTAGGVDCWGSNDNDSLGDGNNDGRSTRPVQVVSTSGTGVLGGAASLVSDSWGGCTLLGSGLVDCWGLGAFGELGSGLYYQKGSSGSATPVPVVSANGSGSLVDVEVIVGGNQGYCALFMSHSLDCWGEGDDGELGNGHFYTAADNFGSAVPVAVDVPK
jgi:alpha-tubulin suppressor-like RCC1 family protein